MRISPPLWRRSRSDTRDLCKSGGIVPKWKRASLWSGGSKHVVVKVCSCNIAERYVWVSIRRTRSSWVGEWGNGAVKNWPRRGFGFLDSSKAPERQVRKLLSWSWLSSLVEVRESVIQGRSGVGLEWFSERSNGNYCHAFSCWYDERIYHHSRWFPISL